MIAWRLGQLSDGTAAPSVNGDNFSHLIESGSRELVAEPEVDLNDPLSWNLLLPKSWKFWNLSKQHHLLRPNIEMCDPVRDISDSNYNILSLSRQARYTQADRNFASTMDKCKGLFALAQAKLKPYKKRRPDSEQFISHRFAVAGKGTLGHCWWAYFSTGVKLTVLYDIIMKMPDGYLLGHCMSQGPTGYMAMQFWNCAFLYSVYHRKIIEKNLMTSSALNIKTC